MTLDELQRKVLDAIKKNHTQILLVVSRKTPPRWDYITVKGMGKGYVCNVKQTENGFDVVAYFRTETIAKSLRREIERLKAIGVLK